jgi:PPOX class probable F420-dependent enzyme
LLKGKNFAFVATLMEDGSPQVTPTWVDTDGDNILINTAQGRLKEKNASRDPRVALSIVDGQNPYNMVAVRGRVIEHTTNGAEEHIDKMAKKYLGLEKYPNRKPGEKRILLKIKPEKVFHMGPQ